MHLPRTVTISRQRFYVAVSSRFLFRTAMKRRSMFAGVSSDAEKIIPLWLWVILGPRLRIS